MAEVQVTIGIPAYNERQRVQKLLTDLSNEGQSAFFDVKEVIVEASGSTDGIEVQIDCPKAGFAFRLIRKPEREGKAASLNTILHEAKGDIVVFIDADVILGQDSIKELMKPFLEDSQVGLVSGNVLSLNRGSDFFTFASKFLRLLHDYLDIELKGRGLTPKVNGTFYAVRKEVLDGFPKVIVSDDEYAAYNVKRLGYLVAYQGTARVWTKDPTNARDYIAKRRRVFGGHLFLKRAVNYQVPSASIIKTLVPFINVLLMSRPNLFKIIKLSGLEVIARGLAFLDVLRNRIPYRYRVESAKFSYDEIVKENY
ncbi:MAG: glycosyltransferase [Nitrososphaerales archaeon]